MGDWWSIGIALLALVVSVVSFFWNWRYSESVFRRTQYPAVAWHQPIISKSENNTAISVTVCNHGPKEIDKIHLGAFLSYRFKREAWCKSYPIGKVPIGEELTIVVTENLEEDIEERFGGLYFDENWHYQGNPQNYRIIFWFEYQPLIADTPSLMRKTYYLLRPIVESRTIVSWEINPASWWSRWLSI